jgi:hypothetical protein
MAERVRFGGHLDDCGRPIVGRWLFDGRGEHHQVLVCEGCRDGEAFPRDEGHFEPATSDGTNGNGHWVACERQFWNSSDGTYWGEPGASSFVYSDSPVKVVRHLYGPAPSTFDLRLVGGTADGVEMVFEASGAHPKVGERYLAFLTNQSFPMEAGADSAWTTVRLGQGLFRRSDSGWVETIQDFRVEDGSVDELSMPIAGS